MKKLLLLMALLSANSYADMYAVAPNQIGGHTILSQKPCSTNPKWKNAYAFGHDKSVSFACWYIERDSVIFVTQSGTIRSMPMKSFEIVVENR